MRLAAPLVSHFAWYDPQAGAIGSDFGRLGLPFWDDVYAVHAHNRRRRELLDELISDVEAPLVTGESGNFGAGFNWAHVPS